ncbi:MAG: trypsin-like peptidase domain-containing protein [Acidobacteriota bacterium]|nr:trypsin-like peptidase domain-containing protein [Acidobacteriota bacterium]
MLRRIPVGRMKHRSVIQGKFPAGAIMRAENTKSHNYDGTVLKPGMEISCASNASSGTLGAIVYDNSSGKPMILTNYHVVSTDDPEEESNNLKLILQRVKHAGWALDEEVAGRIDAGEKPVFCTKYGGGLKSAKIVAFVTRYDKTLDAAVCQLLKGVKFDPDINYQPVTRTTTPVQGKNVYKVGKVTGQTSGKIKQVDNSTPVIIIEKIGRAKVAEQGDSGAVFIDSETDKAVGLLFKGDDQYTYARPISRVESALGISFKKPQT